LVALVEILFFIQPHQPVVAVALNPVALVVELKLVQLVLVILRQQLHLKEIQEVVSVVADLIHILLKVVPEAVVRVVVVGELVVVELGVLVPHLI
jgi:hypothetical protein